MEVKDPLHFFPFRQVEVYQSLLAEKFLNVWEKFGNGSNCRSELCTGYSKGYSSSDSESTSTGVNNIGGVEVSYQAPAARMIIGVVKRYKYENSKTPACVTIQCKSHRFQYDTEIKLLSRTYAHTQFKFYTTQIVEEKCITKIWFICQPPVCRR